MGLFNLFRRKKTSSYQENLDFLFGEYTSEKKMLQEIEEAQEEERETLSFEDYAVDSGFRQQYVKNCCEQIVACSKHIEEAKTELKSITNYISDIQTIQNLPSEIKDKLEYYAKRIVVLGNERTGYKQYAFKPSERGYINIQSREREMPRIIETMAEDEDFCEKARKDLNMLEGEKLAIKYDKSNYLSYLAALRNFSIVAFITLVSVIFVFAYDTFVNHIDRGLVVLGLTVLLAVLVVCAVWLNRKLKYDIKVSDIRLNKAINLSNGVKLKYINVRLKLDYEYEQYDIKNAYELSQRYQNYLRAKRDRENYNKTADSLYQAYNNYNETLHSVRLNDYSVWNSQPSSIVNPEEIEGVMKMLVTRRDSLLKSIENNNELIEKTKARIKKFTLEHREYSQEILAVISNYDEF